MSAITPYLAALVAACCVFLGAKHILYARRCTAEATGTILATDAKRGTDYRFAVDGVERRGHADIDCTRPNLINGNTAYARGDAVRVLYDPRNPDRFRLAFDCSRPIVACICGVVAAFLWAVTRA